MTDHIMHIVGSLPFMLLSEGPQGRAVKVNKVRIVEAVIIASITGTIAGILSAYISLAKVEEKVSGIKDSISSIEKHVEIIDQRVWDHSQKDKR